MKITYIGHSGFLIEWAASYWLFDYYKGIIPEMDSMKKVFVFASHHHKDHFNPEIFTLLDPYHDIQYVLSSDIKPAEDHFRKAGIPDAAADRIVFVEPSEEYVFYDANQDRIDLKTLKSTDCGVAFLLRYQEKTIYHAGDLNLWVWKEESKQNNNNMTALFNKEMSVLKDIPIDIAFAPLDPRQEEWYYMGMESLLNTAKVKYVFPMHFWRKASIIRQFKQERGMNLNHAEVMDVHQAGQEWEMDEQGRADGQAMPGSGATGGEEVKQ